MSKTIRKHSGTLTTVISVIAIALAAILAVGLSLFLWDDNPTVSPDAPQVITVSLNDTITAGAWGGAVEITRSENSPIEEAHFGATYGTIARGQSIHFSGTIKDDDIVETDEIWFTPLIGIYSESVGVIVRMDNWVLGMSPDGSFENAFSGVPNSGEASGSSELWTVYHSGDTFGADIAKGSLSYAVDFLYRADGIFIISQSIETPENGVLITTYSIRVPNGVYSTYFYGENCSYTFMSMTVSEN